VGRFEIVERYRRAGGVVDRLIIPWAVRVVGSAGSVEDAIALRDRLERERPEISPLGIWDADSAETDDRGVTHRTWIDYPWPRGVLGRGGRKACEGLAVARIRRPFG
jgi:hypothetical protein